LPARDSNLLRERAELRDATTDGALESAFLPQKLFNFEAACREKAQPHSNGIGQPET
jgi:hypothetical protein